MEITLEELETIFGAGVPDDPADQKLFLELNSVVVKKRGLMFLSKHKELLLAEWDHIANDLL
jgi:hypothetical protein